MILPQVHLRGTLLRLLLPLSAPVRTSQTVYVVCVARVFSANNLLAGAVYSMCLYFSVLCIPLGEIAITPAREWWANPHLESNS